MTNAINTWTNELTAATIEAGDKITLHCSSDMDALDGDVDAIVERAPDSNYRLELETGADAVMLVVPDSDAPDGATLVQGSALRATGHIAGKTEVATVHGVSQR